MDWIYQFLTDFAAWLNSIAHDFLSAFAEFQTFLVYQIAFFWNEYVVGSFEQYKLAQLLPDPGFGALASWIRAVSPTLVIWTFLDYICYVNVVSSLLSGYLSVWLVVVPYRLWLIIKRAVPFAG